MVSVYGGIVCKRIEQCEKQIKESKREHSTASSEMWKMLKNSLSLAVFVTQSILLAYSFACFAAWFFSLFFQFVYPLLKNVSILSAGVFTFATKAYARHTEE